MYRFVLHRIVVDCPCCVDRRATCFAAHCPKTDWTGKQCAFKIKFLDNPRGHNDDDEYWDFDNEQWGLDTNQSKGSWICMEAEPHSCARDELFVSMYNPDHIGSALWNIQEARTAIPLRAAVRELYKYATGLTSKRVQTGVKRSLEAFDGNSTAKMQYMDDLVERLESEGHRVEVQTIGGNEMKYFIRHETLLRAKKARKEVNEAALLKQLEYV